MRQEKTQRTATICEGPSKFDLIDAFVHAMDKEHVHTVTFTVFAGGESVGPARLQAQVIGIEHEDGSGNSFNLELRVKGNWFDREFLDFVGNGKDELHGAVLRWENKARWLKSNAIYRAYFNTKTRKGSISDD